MITASTGASLGRSVRAGALGILLALAGAVTPRVAGAASWQVVGKMTEGRDYPTATLLLDGSVLLTGGIGNKANKWPLDDMATVDRFDPKTGNFTPQSPMSTLRISPAAMRLQDGRVLFLGGAINNGTKVLDTAELFDPATNAFTPVANKMTTPRIDVTATFLPDGRVLVVGGREKNLLTHALATAELFDPTTGTFQATGALAGPRRNHLAVALPDGRVAILGGQDQKQKPVRRVEIYDPASGTFVAQGELALPDGRGSDTATLLLDGKILVTGGGDTPGRDAAKPNSIEIYDPATGQSGLIGPLSAPRLGHQAILLGDGRVLIAGGLTALANNYAEWLRSAELVDPTTGQSSPAEPMTQPHAFSALVRLADGRPLAVGGETGDAAPNVLDLLAEVYTP
jgi:hypothetical protein